MNSVIKSEVNPILKTLITISLILLSYLLFRFTIGNQIINYIDSGISSNLVIYSSEGETLSEVAGAKLAKTGDVQSSLVTPSQIYLTGSTGVKTSNPKILAMKKFLIDYNSPMHTYADVFVNEAERYGLDWRLVASISGVESAFGNLIPYQTNNAWGWRGGPGGDWSIFPTWKEGIQTVTRGLARGYGTTLTPFQIERAYCPPCYANPAHAWANGVTRFMNELDQYLNNLENL